jgi:bifunctional DNA-binding transcriptional regulator/antitoxin component of YhaV-PrlF toxin-antitoxin module
MQTRMESNGDIVVPGELGRKLGYRPGDTFDLRIEAGGIMVAPHEPAKQHVGKIIEDPLTGWPVFDPGPYAPVLTNEQVLEMLADFP